MKPSGRKIDKAALQQTVLTSIGDPKQIGKLKRQFGLWYHPDKNSANTLFQDTRNFLETCEDPKTVIEAVEHSLRHTYSASSDNGSMSQTYSFSFGLPGIKQTVDLKNALKEIFQVADEDLDRANELLTDHLASFLQKIWKMYNISTAERILFGNKQIEIDLLSMLNNTQDAEFTRKINEMKSSQPKYNNLFEHDAAQHFSLFSALLPDYLNKKEFTDNLYNIYLHLVFKQKEPDIHWLYKKETYADFIGMVLKIPVLIGYLATVFGVISLVTLYAMMPLFLLTFLDPIPLFSIYTALAGTLAWIAPWVVFLSSSITFDTVVNNVASVVNYPALQVATFIDWIVESTFNTKPHATELAGMLSEVNDRKAQAGSSQHSFFGRNQPRDEDNFEANDPNVRLIANTPWNS